MLKIEPDKTLAFHETIIITMAQHKVARFTIFDINCLLNNSDGKL